MMLLWFKLKLIFKANWLTWLSDAFAVAIPLVLIMPITLFVIPFSKDFREEKGLLEFVLMFSTIYILTFILLFPLVPYGWFLSALIALVGCFLNILIFCIILKVVGDIMSRELTTSEKREYFIGKLLDRL